MPFTFSHPAAVLPLNYLPKRWVSLTGLVVGSIVPDFEYFIRMRVLSIYSHTWMGLLWFDLPLGILLMYIYNKIIKDNLIDHLPMFLNRRFSAFRNSKSSHRNSLIIIISVIIGAASHLIWDSFTHPTGYFVLHMRLLKHNVVLFQHTFLLYNILQQLSSLSGALIIIIAIWQMTPEKISIQKPITYYWLIIISTAIIVLAIRSFAGLSFKQYGDVIVTIISGLLVGLIIASVFTKKMLKHS